MPSSALPTTDKGLAAYIANVRPGRKRRWLALGNGLALAIEPSGVKTYQGRFRLKGSLQAKRMTLGFHSAMSLAEARRRLAEVKGEVRGGSDPTLDQRRLRAGSGAVATFGGLVDAYLARRAGAIAPKTLTVETGQLAVMREALGDRRLVDRQDDRREVRGSAFSRELHRGLTT